MYTQSQRTILILSKDSNEFKQHMHHFIMEKIPKVSNNFTNSL